MIKDYARPIERYGISCKHEITAEEAWDFYGIFKKLTKEEKKEIYKTFTLNIKGKEQIAIEDLLETYTLEGVMRAFYSWKAYKEKGIKVGSIIEIPNTEDAGIVLGFEGRYLSVYGDFNREAEHVRLFELKELNNTDRFIDLNVLNL